MCQTFLFKKNFWRQNKQSKKSQKKAQKKVVKKKKVKEKKGKIYNVISVYINYFVFTTIIFFNFFKIWFFDIDVFYYIINNCNIFIFFMFITNWIINNINNDFKAKKHNFVRLFCKKNCLFIIYNVFYIKNCFYNFF